MAVTQEELKKLQADVAAAKKEYQAAEAAYKKFVAANGPSFKVGTPQYEEQLRLDKAVDKAVSQVRVAESAVLDAQQQETKQQAQQDGQRQQKEIAQQETQTAPQHTFVVSRQSTTGLLILTDTTTGKIVARAETPYDLVNIAVQKGAVPENQRQELISQGQAFVQDEDSKQAQQNTTQSAGQQVAQSGDAGVVNPAPPATQPFEPEGRVTAGSNAVTPVTSDTTQGANANTADTTKNLQETQAVTNPPGQGSQLPDPSRQQSRLGDDAKPGPGSPGVGSGNDDSVATKNTTRQEIELSFQEEILPQSNVLDDYASYTYQISWYLLSVDDYRKVINSGRNGNLAGGDVGIDGGQLLMQSGGISASQSANGQDNINRARNPFFSLDYYIDSLQITNVLPGKGTGIASSSTELKMTVIEPNGISLIDNLKQAVKAYAGLKAFSSAIYCLVIRFRGYDENGNPVLVGKTDSGGAKTDPYSIVIKYIPFSITNIKFSVSNRLSTYEIQASCMPYLFRLRQTVPHEVEITGRTVSEILGGQVATTSSSDGARTNTTSQASGGQLPVGLQSATGTGQYQSFQNATNQNILNTIVKASPSVNSPGTLASAPQGTNSPVRSLMQVMNDGQRDLVKQGIYTYPDEFVIQFANKSIANATVRKPGDLAIEYTPMDSSNRARKLANDINQMLPAQRNFSIHAGQSIVQAIEMVVRNSSYITDQQLKRIDESTQQEVANGTPIQNFAWFKISLKSEPIGNTIDPRRGDYPYRFTFMVSIYEVKSIESAWFPRTRFRGVHKTYPYWFTGQNTAVLDYQQNFDNLYYTVVSGNADKLATQITSNYTEIPRFVYQPSSGQSSQGAEGRTNEPAANAADYLYSPSDIGLIKIKILGDPAWIAQGEIYRGNDPRTFNFSAFNTDGTINLEAQEILFEVVWQRPVDYDADGTGLMNPNYQFNNGVN